MIDRKSALFVLLAAIFITNALLAEVIGVKIFSLESLFHLPQAQLLLFTDEPLDFNLTSGVLLWPVVFVTTDIINEYFGKEGVKRISFITAGLICYAFIILLGVTHLPPAQFWLAINGTDLKGLPFDINFAFSRLFTQSLGIMIGSLVAFLLGQLLDAYVFHRLRSLTGARFIWLRATGSTLFSQLVDSFVVLGIAFYVFGNWSIAMVLSVGLVNYVYKCIVAILLTPVLYLAHTLIDRYLGKEVGQKISDTAAKESKGFF